MANKIFSEWFSDVIQFGMVDDGLYSFDARSDDPYDDYSHFFEVSLEDGPRVLTTDDEFSFQAIETWDQPMMVVRNPEGGVIGWYHNWMAWVDEEYRGRGFGVELILKYAEHFQDQAWELQYGEKDPAAGMGFSDHGMAIHERALELARLRLNTFDQIEAAASPTF